MTLELSQTNLVIFTVAMLVASSHVFLAIIGFRQPYYNLPAGRYFSLSLIGLGWSVFCIGFVNAGLASYYPFFYIGSPLFSGLIPTSFFLYCQSVTQPERRPNPWWLLFALPGFVYALSILSIPGGVDDVAAVWNGQGLVFHPVLTPLFIVHTTVLLTFCIASMVVTVRARSRAESPVRIRTLNWLSSVIITGIVLVIITNLLPLLGLIRLSGVGFQALTTLPIAILMYRTLRALWDEDEASKREETAQQERMASLGRMARGVAHDINNLLMGITGHMELARIKGDHPNLVEEHLQKGLQIASHASELQKKLQTFSGGLTPHRTPLDTKAVLTELVDELQATIPVHCTLTADIHPQASVVCIGAAELHGAVNNLILNAMEAMPEGGKIQLSTVPINSARIPKSVIGANLNGQSCLKIVVQDDGHGMTTEIRSRVLEPFYSTKGAGRGLGMASVLAVVRETGGAMEIDSTLGKSTTVRLWLPITSESVLSSSPEEFDAPLKTRKVLLVDDNPEVLEVLTELLIELNQDVLAIRDGESAIEAIRKEPDTFSWALVDVQMPEINGVDVAQKLQSLSEGLTVYLMSGDESKERITETFGESSIELLRKPISLTQLKRLCARKEPRASSARAPKQ